MTGAAGSSPDEVEVGDALRQLGDDLERPVLGLKALLPLLEPPRLPLPGSGFTWERFLVLAAIAEHDVALGRLAEGHADALAILDEARRRGQCDAVPAQGATLGVWAAGPPNDLVLREKGDGLALDGRRRWCSGAGSLGSALVTALPEKERTSRPRLVLCRLDAPGIEVDFSSWPAVGMARSETFDVVFHDVPLYDDALVGPPGFYTERPGFYHGAAGVAACWWGAARGIVRPLSEKAASSKDPHVEAAHGEAAASLFAIESCLRRSAALFDSDPEDKSEKARSLAEITRLVTLRQATRVIEKVADATGAEPLCHDKSHARRVADLLVYLHQHHGARDAAALSLVLGERGWPR